MVHPAFRRFWWATSISEAGTYFTTLAVQVLIVVQLGGSAADVGLVNGARWLPYLLFGVVAGVLVDRMRRRPVLITADFVRAGLLLAVPLLAWTGSLPILVLAGLMALLGLASLAGDAAAQALVPRLVPVDDLTRAHASLDRAAAVAQAGGPALAGMLIGLIGAARTVLVDAASYLVSGVLLLFTRVAEPVPERAARQGMWTEIREGLRWVYRHRTLGPFAIATHGWFLFSALAGVVLVPFAVDTVGLSPLLLGIALALAGVGAFVGSSAAAWLGERLGTGRLVIAAQAGTGIAWGVVALTPVSGWAGVVAGAGQFLLGVAMGASNANEMAYRQSVTPDRLQGRMNATMRSVNRAMIVIAAPLGGLLADAIGYRPGLFLAAGGMLLTALLLLLSPFRAARVGE
ncbi:MFS transporter [Nakamurella alba]|uniref:MFS transporter n=1 Tax=Nakamurella alba TaxID=2665158 RepID=UPI002AC338BF|nr:MFS transporter [Nakamurella alba]